MKVNNTSDAANSLLSEERVKWVESIQLEGETKRDKKESRHRGKAKKQEEKWGTDNLAQRTNTFSSRLTPFHAGLL